MATVRRAILVGGDPLALRGLREHLAMLPDLTLLAEVATDGEAVTWLQVDRPDLVFLQPERLPNHGLDLSKSIRKQLPTVKLVVITHRTEVDLILAYAELGVAAYFRDDNLAGLAGDLGSIEAGQVVLDRRLVGDIMRLLSTPLGQSICRALETDPATAPPCSPRVRRKQPGPRRRKVLGLVGQGYTDKEVAQSLGIQPSTVADHLRRERAIVGPVRRATFGRTYSSSRRD